MIVHYYARKCTHNGNETDKRTEAKVRVQRKSDEAVKKVKVNKAEIGNLC